VALVAGNDVRRQLEAGVGGDATDHGVRRPRRDPHALRSEKQRLLTVGGAALTLLDPLLENRGMNRELSRRLLAEFLGSAFLAALVINSGIAAQELSPDDTGLPLLAAVARVAPRAWRGCRGIGSLRSSCG